MKKQVFNKYFYRSNINNVVRITFKHAKHQQATDVIKFYFILKWVSLPLESDHFIFKQLILKSLADLKKKTT
jgi:hypothetical protein